MISAAKSRWFNAWFARHARSRIRHTFGRVEIAGLEAARAAAAGAPLLVVANHSTWWDALVALYVSELLLRCDGYAMMDAANLRRVPFFRRVGAFGVDLDDPADGARAIRHAVRLLDAPGRVLWIFPEGRERSPFAPLELRPGAAQIARVAKRALVVPVGLRYVFGGAEHPELWISLGRPLARDAGRERDVTVGVARQREGIEHELARIDAAIAARAGTGGAVAGGGFESVLARRASVIGRIAERLLVRLLPA
jgi:1-acyl-sn-glycerol-3-phosphate acyltransferase